MYKLLAITNRKLCNKDFLEKIQDICRLNEKEIKYVSIVLREKDLSENEYKDLATKVLEVCKNNNTECILHTYFNVAKELECKKIHLSLHLLKSNPNVCNDFDEVGVSIHSVSIPVYAIGGISPENSEAAINAGAEGICIMSGLMTCKNPRLFISK